MFSMTDDRRGAGREWFGVGGGLFRAALLPWEVVKLSSVAASLCVRALLGTPGGGRPKQGVSGC